MTASTGLSVGHAVRVPRARQWAFAMILVTSALVLAFARFGLHMTASSVLTGSMRPAFAPGDAVITRPVPIASVHPGMVILATPAARTAPFAHRIIAVRHQDRRILVQTQGDANPSPDDWEDVYTSTSTVSEVVATVPKLGYVLEAVHGRTTQRSVVPVAVAGLVLTFAACAFVLFAGTSQRKPMEATP
jgi:signal peptidase I